MKQIPTGYYCVISLEKKSKTFAVRFPDYPGIITYGKDFDHAVAMAGEALTAVLESDFDRDQSLPASHKPKSKKGKLVFIPLDAEVRVAYVLRCWRENAGLSQMKLAAKMGISFQAYQRMERPGRSNLTVATLQRIAKALNKSLVLDVKN